jgi:hypothetical protein
MGGSGSWDGPRLPPLPVATDVALASSTACLRLQRLRAAFEQEDPVYPGASSPGADSTSSPPSGFQQTSFCIAGDGFSTYPSVAQCSISGYLVPPSTNTWCGPSIPLSSPPATHQLTTGEFILVAVVYSVVFRSVDLVVIQPSLKVCFVKWLLNI